MRVRSKSDAEANHFKFYNTESTQLMTDEPYTVREVSNSRINGEKLLLCRVHS